VSWLRDFVEIDATAEELAETLASAASKWRRSRRSATAIAVIDFEVTANRPDCLSVIGLAREVATAYDRPITLPSASPGAKLPLKPSPAGVSIA
jgi:phenylalanyl-tRNA synthetase beta chain